MRLDKYLHSIRYFKTRGLASSACKNNKVKLNGDFAKASKDVLLGDEIDIRKDALDTSLSRADNGGFDR